MIGHHRHDHTLCAPQLAYLPFMQVRLAQYATHPGRVLFRKCAAESAALTIVWPLGVPGKHPRTGLHYMNAA